MRLLRFIQWRWVAVMVASWAYGYRTGHEVGERRGRIVGAAQATSGLLRSTARLSDAMARRLAK